LVIDSPRLFNATALELSWVLFAQALGTILGSIVTPKLRIKNNAKGVFYGLSLNYTGVLSATAAIMNQNLPALIISSLIEGISLPLANISSQNIWQTAVPLDLQGRVYSVRRFIAQITSPIAMFSSGVLGEVIFEEYVIGSFASLGLIFLLYLWFLTKLPQVEEIVGASSTKSAQTIPADN
jgi:predicted MFS family arabinose efflux permease